MGTTLTGTTPQDTYDSLIKVTDNGPLSATAKYLSDGLGNDSALALSTSKVGIGTASPTGKLTVSSGAAGGGYNSDYDELVLSNAGRVGINILSSTTEFSAIIMGGKADNTTGGIYHNASTNMLSLATQDAFRLNIDNAGNVGIGTSNPVDGKLCVTGATAAGNSIVQTYLTVAAASTRVTADGRYAIGLDGAAGATERVSVTVNGLTFNGDTAAANALDDYEEGTFSPTIIGTTTAGTATYGGGQQGLYTKIGRMVYFSIYLGYSGGTGTGNLRISGLPFTISAVDVPSISIGTFLNVALTALNIPIVSGIPSTTQLSFEQIPTGGGTQTAVPYDGSAVIVLSGFYQV